MELSLDRFLRLPFLPVIHQLINAITSIESASIDAISFYKDTSGFVKFLQENENYNGISVTGHSLGGGLSIITGAQMGIPAVALSGPNAMLSRASFDPPISVEDLDSKTFVSAVAATCTASLTLYRTEHCPSA